jgi:hypothetical protein
MLILRIYCSTIPSYMFRGVSLDADTQTISGKGGLGSSSNGSALEVSEQIAQVELSLITRINEIEIQNYELMKKIDIVCL